MIQLQCSKEERIRLQNFNKKQQGKHPTYIIDYRNDIGILLASTLILKLLLILPNTGCVVC